VQDPLHLAAKVTAPGDLTSATVEFKLSDASGQPVIEPIQAKMAADGFSSAAITGLDVGVYQLEAKVGGAAYLSASVFQTISIYDPEGQFVTGGGSINSPAGAYTLGQTLTGKATFAFVAKYTKGNSVLSGNTEFHFKAADLHFASTAYDWLVVSGARAQYQGVGTINGSGSYGFLLTAIDVHLPERADRFRLKIWNLGTDAIIYDNQLGAPDAAAPTTVLSGGSISIQK